jgi:cytidylate kinase
MQAYGIDYTLPEHYDLVIDTDEFSSPEEVAQYIFNYIKNKVP